MRTHVPWRRTCALFTLPLLLGLMSCGSVNTVPAAGQTATALARVSLLPASPLPASATSCNEVPEMVGGQITYLYNLNFPDDGIATGTITSSTSAQMQVVAYDACFRIGLTAGTPTPMGTPMDQVQEVLGVFERGWVLSKVFPSDGNSLAKCAADQRCFMADPQTYALLEQARENQNGLVEFSLRMALPQPLVPCDPILFPIYTYPDSISPYWAAQIPLPPGTRFSIGRGTQGGITEYFCSAGTAKDINAFMQEHLPKVGWQQVDAGGVKLWTIQTSGAPRLYMRLNPVTDPRKWSELEYYQGFTP